jgi:ABC-2 type transport system permease protein
VAPATPGYWALHGFQAAVTGDTHAYAHSTAVIAAITATALLVPAHRIRH